MSSLPLIRLVSDGLDLYEPVQRCNAFRWSIAGVHWFGGFAVPQRFLKPWVRLAKSSRLGPGSTTPRSSRTLSALTDTTT